MEVLQDGNAHGLAQEAVVIRESKGRVTRCWQRRGCGAGRRAGRATCGCSTAPHRILVSVSSARPAPYFHVSRPLPGQGRVHFRLAASPKRRAAHAGRARAALCSRPCGGRRRAPAARATRRLHASRALASAAHALHVRAYGQGVRPSVDRACQLARVLQDGVALELRHTAARDGGLRQQSAGAVAAARGRAALVFVTCAAANPGGLSGWMRASTAAQTAASRLHPPFTPPVFLRLPPPLESLARATYTMLR